MRPLLELKYQIQENNKTRKAAPVWVHRLSVSFYIHLRKCVATLPAATQQENVKVGTLSVKEPNRRDGTANPSKGAWQASDLCATVRVWSRQRRNAHPRSVAGQIKGHGQPVAKRHQLQPKLKRLCPPQFLRTGIFPHAAFVLNMAKVKRDGYLARTKSPEIARTFGTDKLPIPEKLTGNEH